MKAKRQTHLTQDKLRKELRKMLQVKKVDQHKVEAAGFKGKKFSNLGVLELEKWYLDLKGTFIEKKTIANCFDIIGKSGSSTPTDTNVLVMPTCLGKRKRNTEKAVQQAVMNLYLHNMVLHIPDFFESMDFKNSNTERFEGFLAVMKKVLNDSTNRNPNHPHAVLQVFIRHHFRGVGAEYKGKYYHPLYSKITRHFSKSHVMKELQLKRTPANAVDLDALLKTLKADGYSQFVVSSDGSVLFDTLDDAQQLQAGLTPDLSSFRVDIEELYDDPLDAVELCDDSRAELCDETRDEQYTLHEQCDDSSDEQDFCDDESNDSSDEQDFWVCV